MDDEQSDQHRKIIEREHHADLVGRISFQVEIFPASIFE
jgi:hypothetical protein